MKLVFNLAFSPTTRQSQMAREPPLQLRMLGAIIYSKSLLPDASTNSTLSSC